MAHSRVIPKDQLDAISRWDAPDVTGGASKPSGTPLSQHPEVLTAHRIEELQQQAYEEGFEQGRKEGREAGLAEMKAAAERFVAALDLLAHPLDELDETVTEQLLRLVTVIAQQMIRRELKTSPGEIIAVVRETLALLPVASRQVRVHLNPDDAALVREVLSPPEGERGWEIVEDPVITAGGCQVFTEMSRIDATVESRLMALVAGLLGGERQDDQPQSEE
ncbi:MAG: flagellar assembly protein FliH [Gammaproteobacteria bacterium]